MDAVILLIDFFALNRVTESCDILWCKFDRLMEFYEKNSNFDGHKQRET